MIKLFSVKKYSMRWKIGLKILKFNGLRNEWNNIEIL